MRCLLALFLTLVVATPAVANPAALPAIAAGPVRAVEPGLVLRLADGQALRLALLLTEDAAQAEALQSPLAALVEGHSITLHWPTRQRDRHGRLIGHAIRDDGLWIQAALVASGTARLMPFATEDTLLAPLLATEATARIGHHGRWAEPEHGVLSPLQAPAAIGRFAVVEGSVLATTEVRDTIYLNFGPDWRTDFTVVLPKAMVKALRAAGQEPLALKGQAIRVRGWVRRHNGPSIELSAPGQIETVNTD